jgi:hypothetical protein
MDSRSDRIEVSNAGINSREVESNKTRHRDDMEASTYREANKLRHPAVSKKEATRHRGEQRRAKVRKCLRAKEAAN